VKITQIPVDAADPVDVGFNFSWPHFALLFPIFFLLPVCARYCLISVRLLPVVPCDQYIIAWLPGYYENINNSLTTRFQGDDLPDPSVAAVRQT
jgi:hypothetical protein